MFYFGFFEICTTAMIFGWKPKPSYQCSISGFFEIHTTAMIFGQKPKPSYQCFISGFFEICTTAMIFGRKPKPSYQCSISGLLKYTPPQWSLVENQSLAINVLFQKGFSEMHKALPKIQQYKTQHHLAGSILCRRTLTKRYYFMYLAFG